MISNVFWKEQIKKKITGIERKKLYKGYKNEEKYKHVSLVVTLPFSQHY